MSKIGGTTGNGTVSKSGVWEFSAGVAMTGSSAWAFFVNITRNGTTGNEAAAASYG